MKTSHKVLTLAIAAASLQQVHAQTAEIVLEEVQVTARKQSEALQDVPDVVPAGDPDGDLLLIGWGSTYGAITAALRAQRGKGKRIGHVHLRWLNPLPKNLGEVLKRYKKVVVPEMNMGQLVWLLRAKYLVDVVGYNHVRGLPLRAAELAEAATHLIESTGHASDDTIVEAETEEITS